MTPATPPTIRAPHQAPPRRRLPRWAVVLVVAVVGALTAAIVGLVTLLSLFRTPYVEGSDLSHPMPERSRGDRGEVRRDADPLVAFMGALGDPREVAWQAGTIDQGRTPGLDIYWREGVVHLEPGRARQLVEDHGARPAEAPVIDGDLAPSLPAGPWVLLNDRDEVVPAGWFGPVYVDVEDDRLVFLLIGDP